ncbi:MAG TPA: histidine phosphatase family protein, partial [Bacillaceae bacterium]
SEQGFRERTLASGPVEDFEYAVAKVWEDPTFAWEGGESNRDAQKRGLNATLGVLQKNVGKNIVIGTHGNIMVLIMNHFNQSFDYNFWRQLEMPDIYKLSFEGKRLVNTEKLWRIR